jgi:sporulation protein YlmC with PRC-barrel domain
MASEFLSWGELSDRPVNVAGQGRQIGLVDNFYYNPETQSIPSLRVKTRLNGSRVLLASAIAIIRRDGVTVANENMLIDEANAGHLYHLPQGRQLLGARVISEQGHELGVVDELLLGIYPPIALRISAFEIWHPRKRRISAQAILRIGHDTLTIAEQGVS